MGSSPDPIECGYCCKGVLGLVFSKSKGPGERTRMSLVYLRAELLGHYNIHASMKVTLANFTATSLSHAQISNVEMMVQVERNKYFPKKKTFSCDKTEFNCLGIDFTV